VATEDGRSAALFHAAGDLAEAENSFPRNRLVYLVLHIASPEDERIRRDTFDKFVLQF